MSLFFIPQTDSSTAQIIKSIKSLKVHLGRLKRVSQTSYLNSTSYGVLVKTIAELIGRLLLFLECFYHIEVAKDLYPSKKIVII